MIGSERSRAAAPPPTGLPVSATRSGACWCVQLPVCEVRAFAIDEGLALNLGLLFRALAPMRSADNMRARADGIEAMGREEAAYWLGMAMHRKNPRRVLFAQRVRLTDAHHAR